MLTAPTTIEIDRAVSLIYEKRSESVGGGGWLVTKVNLVGLAPGADEGTYIIEVIVKGIHKSPPLAIPRPDGLIDERRKMRMVWEGQWMCVEE